MRYSLLIFLTLFSLKIHAQEVEKTPLHSESDTSDIEEIMIPLPEEQEEETFYQVEKMPEFPGGVEALYAYIEKQIQYPVAAIDAEISGKVYVQFTVTREGEVKNERVMRGIGGGCEEEALRVISIMPDWIPGEHLGKVVNVGYMLPITFTLGSHSPASEEMIDLRVAEYIDPADVYMFAEEMPDFPGGIMAYNKYVTKNIDYPKEALNANVSGKVYVQLIVYKDGSASGIRVVKGIGYGCDEEALRVLKTITKWEPGKQRGKPANIKLTISVPFDLPTPPVIEND